MTIFSFRTANDEELQAFNKAATERGIHGQLVARSLPGHPDQVIEMDVGATLEEVRECMRSLAPLNYATMIQTLRECPLAENSLQPDESITR
jgi:hypothetical protein